MLNILTGADHPTLRKKTTEVKKVTREVLKLLRDMEVTLRAAEGVGLAAPQVGTSLRVCLAMLQGKVTPLINPRITWRSEETIVDQEGCLSLPGVWLQIPRACAVTLRYRDVKGKAQERRLEGFDARVVQHEVDHLDGILIIDSTG